MKLANTRKARLLLPLLLVLIQACSSSTNSPTQSAPGFNPLNASIDELVSAANTSAGLRSTEFRLLALEALIDGGLLERAARQSAFVGDLTGYPEPIQFRALLLQAKLALGNNRAGAALEFLAQTNDRGLQELPELRRDYRLTLGRAYQDSGQYEQALAAYLQLGDADENNSNLDFNVHNEIWDAINISEK
jgi:outer membrane PBP1 activator LpoA protein